ncbi:hypothetical protein, partial [Bifidobacterium longum]|uniref:hypothetical protein n=1 Tax=Bifidobacterium longum TaxID=216816 RepID=UPI001A955F2C
LKPQVLQPPLESAVRGTIYIIYVLGICRRHHAHDGQGNSNNRSKAAPQDMAMLSRFLFYPSVKPATAEL